MAIVITKQPQNAQVMEGKITQKLTVKATGATTYQWKQAKSGTSVSGATIVSGQNTSVMTIPTTLTEGRYYYFCAISDASSTVNSDIVTVEVVRFPEYITGKFVNEYVAACDPSVKKDLDAALARTGIEIPNTDDVLRTAQVELFISVL